MLRKSKNISILLIFILAIGFCSAPFTKETVAATNRIDPQAKNKNSIDSIKKIKVISKAPVGKKKVALTFDDGPFPHYTEEYIKVLKDHNVNATFFLVGSSVKKYPEMAKLIAKEGFEIGNHSFSHKDLSEMSIKDLNTDLFLTNYEVKNITNKNPDFLRPPYGFYNDALLKVAKNNSLTVVTWSVDPKDWEGIPSNEITQRVVRNADDGDIILLHEGNKNTLIALPKIIKQLQEKGFEIVSVSELLKFQEDKNNKS